MSACKPIVHMLSALGTTFIKLRCDLGQVKEITLEHKTLTQVDLSGNKDLILSNGSFTIGKIEHVVLEEIPRLNPEYMMKRAVNVCAGIRAYQPDVSGARNCTAAAA